MIRSNRNFRPSTPDQARGFSLVELLVAALIMAFSSMGGTLLFGEASRQASSIRDSLQQQFLISNELAVIRDHNDRYTCASGSCTVKLDGDPPNQEQYIPKNDPNAPTPYKAFLGLCDSGLVSDLITHINTPISQLVDPKVVKREAILDPASTIEVVEGTTKTTKSVAPHRYLVTWSAGGRQVRQVQLIPTVAAWCP